ncbi:MAG: DUF2239 family protein [Deltaproteobacteria bacterium]|nr:DUF2239 family protein [Deltaproteobacteria bacterium]
METNITFTAFAGDRLIASESLEATLLRTKEYLDSGGAEPVLIFEDRTGGQVDFDFRGTPGEVLGRLPAHPLFAPGETPGRPRTGPGRPKLGVVCREVSLLPRHWDWLERQPNGISAALRRLVEEARKRDPGEDRSRAAREAASRFMTAMAGNFPGFEEASRALFAGDDERFEQRIRDWPTDIRNHLKRLVDAPRMTSAAGE